MHLDSDRLCARFQREWPAEFELSQLRELVEAQDAEIQRLNASRPPAGGYDPAAVRPYIASVPMPDADPEGGRHGG